MASKAHLVHSMQRESTNRHKEFHVDTDRAEMLKEPCKEGFDPKSIDADSLDRLYTHLQLDYFRRNWINLARKVNEPSETFDKAVLATLGPSDDEEDEEEDDKDDNDDNDPDIGFEEIQANESIPPDWLETPHSDLPHVECHTDVGQDTAAESRKQVNESVEASDVKRWRLKEAQPPQSVKASSGHDGQEDTIEDMEFEESGGSDSGWEEMATNSINTTETSPYEDEAF